MKTQWQPYIKPTLLVDIYRLPEKETQQVFAKIGMLLQDPLLDGKLKKQLKYRNREVYRLRFGHFRLFYTLSTHLTLRRHDEATYNYHLEPQMEISRIGFAGLFNI